MKWLWLFVTDPATAFDWHDQSGTHMDHSKVMSSVLLMVMTVPVLVVSIRTRTYPPTALLLVLFSASFGARVFLALIKSRAITSSEVTTQSTIITDRRDADRGAEAS